MVSYSLIWIGFLSLICWRTHAQHVIVERVPFIPDEWARRDSQNASNKTTLSIALKQRRMEALKARLEKISNLDGGEYGDRLSRSEVRAFRTAERADVNLVMTWLSENGIDESVHRQGWIEFNATIDKVEVLLQAEQLAYYAFEDQEPVLRAQSYSLPRNIYDVVDFIQPLASFIPLVRGQVQVDADAGPEGEEHSVQKRRNTCGRHHVCNNGTEPDCIRELYNIQYEPPDETSPVRFGVPAFLEQYLNALDTASFMQKFAPEIHATGYNYSVALVSGAENSQRREDAGFEANLDVQYAMALGFPADVIFYSVAGRGVKLDDDGRPHPPHRTDNEPFLEWLEYLLELPDEELPHVISISYANDELTVPRAYAIRTCDEFAALAARGVSVITSTGNGGARGLGARRCYSNDGRMRPMTIPTFPASCPYVTAVGSTGHTAPPVQGAWFTAGGFSNYFPRQSWQDEAVEEYIERLNGTLQGYYNASGRAFPDLAAIGTGFAYVNGGRDGVGAGTSASTPVVAAMIALVNDARMRRGLGPTGWLNPTLYSARGRAVLQDIVIGESLSCVWDAGQYMPGGWPAKEGYDCLTGLGVPNDFEKLLNLFLSDERV